MKTIKIQIKAPKPYNPLANIKADPLYRKRVVKNAKAYSRKNKHRDYS